MNILQATKSYEDWMRTCTTLVESQLRDKHARMKQDLFVFFRGTFYRWIQLRPKVGGDLRTAPEVLAVGDLHVDSFGTWRDTEGRLAWGVDDFDESYPMSYTNDLVRLAASVKIAIDSETLAIGLKKACEVILNGYRDTLKNEGCPFVLAEQEQNLEKLGVREIVPPKDFWRRLNEGPAIRQTIPRAAKEALEAKLPKGLDYRVILREAGTGSLGRQRFVAIGEWEGGYIAREAKAVTPSACAWLDGRKGSLRSYYEDAIEAAVRSRDPFQKIIKGWLIRRLSPIPIRSRSLIGRQNAMNRLFFTRWDARLPTSISERPARSGKCRTTFSEESPLGLDLLRSRWPSRLKQTGGTTSSRDANRLPLESCAGGLNCQLGAAREASERFAA
ncbi:MAG: DUF2252 family protein, partial [Candidatus Binataceae bacterium]